MIAPAKVSEVLLEQMARLRPAYLVRLLSADIMDGADTALAIEVAARMLPTMDVRPILVQALRHRSPIVREAVIRELAVYAHDSQVRALVRRHATLLHEESAAVREVASDTLVGVP